MLVGWGLLSRPAPSREDFNIAYKGANPTLPIRNWDEAALPEQLRKVCVCVGARGQPAATVTAACCRAWWLARAHHDSRGAQAVDRAGYKRPSPIQMAAIPLGLQFRDVIGIAGGHEV